MSARPCYRIGDLGALPYQKGGYMSRRIIQHCEWCGNPFESYPSAYRRFCCSHCFYSQASRAVNPDGYKRHPHLSEYNKAVNPSRMTEPVKEKLRRSHLGCGAGKSYEKLYGRHVHRVVAEGVLGRKLLSGEVVHHIDDSPRNNAPDNLLVMPSQKAHILLHLQKGDLLREHAESK